MRPLVDFINHGALPFIGREQELDALVAFWRDTVATQGLRIASLQGEAGIGKSRLIEELIPRIVSAGGVVVHTKFYPESTTSIVPLLARALWHSRGGRKLLSTEPQETLGAVVAALQRIARLRPTVVVVEDLHLLGEDQADDDKGVPIRELATLLNTLAGETTSFICVGRPLPAGLRGMIEPWLVREIHLRGLSEEDYRTLWTGIFGGSPGDDALRPLHDATLGNPLAIRSALRGAINAGAIARADAGEGWSVTVPAEAFSRRLEQSVGVLSEGMAVHLTAAEREAACAIASLGEVVARESAMQIMAGSERSLDGLIFKGILVLSESSATPLGAPASRFPLLAFTHTLVHKHFVALSQVDASALLTILASADAPLYSLLPFQRLPDLPPSSTLSGGILRAAVNRCFTVAYAINETSDWKRAADVGRTGGDLIEIYRERWSEDDLFALEAQHMINRLALLWRTPLAEEYLELVDRLMIHTEGRTAGPAVGARMMALLHLHRKTWRGNPERAAEIHEEVERLVEHAPELRSTWTYGDHLRDITHTAWALGNRTALRRAEEELDRYVGDEQIPEPYRLYGRNGVERYLLTLFDTPEELERRRELLARLEAAGLAADPMVTVQRLVLHEVSGEIDRQIEVAERALPRFLEQGLQIEITYARIAKIIGEILLGADMEESLARAYDFYRNVPEPITMRMRGNIGTRLLTAALLRGDEANARRILEDHAGDRFVLPNGARTLLGIDNDEPETLDSSGPLFRLEDIIHRSATLLKDGSAGQLQPMLLWLEERRLPAILSAMLIRHGALLGSRELGRWRKRVEELERQRRVEQVATEQERMSVSMLGVIEIRRTGMEPARLRGARLRTVLGVMVAEKLLPEPLSYREFCRIAAGEDDLESARKILNVTIFRLRETMGAEAIVTGGETPQLNAALLDIDLVDAHTCIRAATEAARNGTLVRALPLLRQAMGIMRSEVAFPGLYDSFFEALREDLEHELRAAIIEVAKGLMQEGDAGSAEELLRYGTVAMPGDIELLELLRAALVALGRRADAERIRMRQS